MQGGASIILRVAERHELCPSSEAYSQRRSGFALAMTLTGRMDRAVFSRYAKPLSPFITYDGVRCTCSSRLGAARVIERGAGAYGWA